MAYHQTAALRASALAVQEGCSRPKAAVVCVLPRICQNLSTHSPCHRGASVDSVAWDSWIVTTGGKSTREGRKVSGSKPTSAQLGRTAASTSHPRSEPARYQGRFFRQGCLVSTSRTFFCDLPWIIRSTLDGELAGTLARTTSLPAHVTSRAWVGTQVSCEHRERETQLC